MRQIPVPNHLALLRLAVRAWAHHHSVGSTTSTFPAGFPQNTSAVGQAESATGHADRP